jgi:chorismate synthase
MTSFLSPDATGIRWRTAGESHGPALIALLEGLPAGLKVDKEAVVEGLRKRWEGPGRGPRAKFEKDALQWLSGLKKGYTLGSPLAILVGNADTRIDELPDLKAPRPGHADLPGVMRHRVRDMRAILERASARETAARTSMGEVCRQLLAHFGIQVSSKVVGIGGESNPDSWESRIDEAREAGDSLGGIFEVTATGCFPGMGGYAQPVDRLDARLMGVLASVPAIKGVEIGVGMAAGETCGSAYHDEICVDSEGWYGVGRSSNRAGGIEGGMTNGQDIILRAAMKPIPTMRRGAASIHLETGKPSRATYERSDVCAIFAASVVGQAMVCLELASALRARLGGTTLAEMKVRFQGLHRDEKTSDWPASWELA